MNNLLELAERCEKATGPDRALDVKIAKAVGRYGSIVLGSSSVNFTHSLDAALTLVPEGAEWSKQYGFFEVEAPIPGESGWVTSVPADKCATDALGLCAAALKARAEAASADTRPEGGDGTEIAAPFTSGAVPKADAQTTSRSGGGNASSGNPPPSNQ